MPNSMGIKSQQSLEAAGDLLVFLLAKRNEDTYYLLVNLQVSLLNLLLKLLNKIIF